MKWAVIQPLNGGMAIGFEKILGNPEFVISNNNNNDEHYIKYIKDRNLDIPIIKMDWDLQNFEDYDNYYKISSEESKKLFEKYNKNIDIVCAVPVCAGLSLLNCQNDKTCDVGRGNPNNKQNQNMYNVTEFVLSKIQPKVYVFENAPTAYTKLGEGVMNNLYNIAQKYNYSITVEKVNTYDFGIPQKRERTFVYFFKEKYSKILKFEKQNTPNLIDFFNEIDKNSLGYNEVLGKLDLIFKYIKEKYAKNKKVADVGYELFGEKFISTLKIIEKLNDFDNLISYVEANEGEKLPNKKLLSEKLKYIKSKLQMNKGYWDISNVFHTKYKYINALISKSIFYIIHPSEKRVITKREALKLMGMPDDYYIYDNKISNFCAMTTQSVPVNTASHAAKNCKYYIENKLKDFNASFAKQNNIKEKLETEVKNINIF